MDQSASPDRVNDIVKQSRGYTVAKRILDIVVSIIGIAVCIIPAIIIMVLIMCMMK